MGPAEDGHQGFQTPHKGVPSDGRTNEDARFTLGGPDSSMQGQQRVIDQRPTHVYSYYGPSPGHPLYDAALHEPARDGWPADLHDSWHGRPGFPGLTGPGHVDGGLYDVSDHLMTDWPGPTATAVQPGMMHHDVQLPWGDAWGQPAPTYAEGPGAFGHAYAHQASGAGRGDAFPQGGGAATHAHFQGGSGWLAAGAPSALDVGGALQDGGGEDSGDDPRAPLQGQGGLVSGMTRRFLTPRAIPRTHQQLEALRRSLQGSHPLQRRQGASDGAPPPARGAQRSATAPPVARRRGRAGPSIAPADPAHGEFAVNPGMHVALDDLPFTDLLRDSVLDDSLADICGQGDHDGDGAFRLGAPGRPASGRGSGRGRGRGRGRGGQGSVRRNTSSPGDAVGATRARRSDSLMLHDSTDVDMSGGSPRPLKRQAAATECVMASPTASQPSSADHALVEHKRGFLHPSVMAALEIPSKSPSGASHADASNDGSVLMVPPVAAHVAAASALSPGASGRSSKLGAVSQRPMVKQGSSRFRGVTRHRWTGRFEAHLWDSSVQRKQSKAGRSRGKQIYLGGFPSEEDAARAYDRASIVWWGESAMLNYPWDDYKDEVAVLTALSRDAATQRLRTKEAGFVDNEAGFHGVLPAGKAGWRAVYRHADARGTVELGRFEEAAQAAMAYDRAAIDALGVRAVLNFQLGDYCDEDAIQELYRRESGGGGADRRSGESCAE
ncbi:unnamed protein product [Pedinophyceae sp. YPF-701]|nr:unnamed protein product [Pedinophyceae sp. YPF-701]